MMLQRQTGQLNVPLRAATGISEHAALLNPRQRLCVGSPAGCADGRSARPERVLFEPDMSCMSTSCAASCNHMHNVPGIQGNASAERVARMTNCFAGKAMASSTPCVRCPDCDRQQCIPSAANRVAHRSRSKRQGQQLGALPVRQPSYAAAGCQMPAAPGPAQSRAPQRSTIDYPQNSSDMWK